MNAAPQSTVSSRPRAASRSRVYLWAGLLATLLAFVGFWPTYFGPLVAGQLESTIFIHIHAFIFVTWLALFITQIALAAAGRISLHIRVGQVIMVFGMIVICSGVVIAFNRFGVRLATGDPIRAQRWLFGVLRDVVFFAPFLAAGWLYRRKVEIHKRVMIVATTILVLPAVSRMVFLGAPVPLWKFMLVWPLPVYVAMIHDYATKKLVHPVYLIGVAAMLMMRLVLPLRDSQVWMKIAGSLASLYAN